MSCFLDTPATSPARSVWLAHPVGEERLSGRQALYAEPQFPAAAKGLTEANVCTMMKSGAYEALLGNSLPPHRKTGEYRSEKNHHQNKYRYTTVKSYVNTSTCDWMGATFFPPGPSSRHIWIGRLCDNSPNAAITSGGLGL